MDEEKTQYVEVEAKNEFSNIIYFSKYLISLLGDSEWTGVFYGRCTYLIDNTENNVDEKFIDTLLKGAKGDYVSEAKDYSYNKSYKRYCNERATIVVGKKAIEQESLVQAVEEMMIIQTIAPGYMATDNTKAIREDKNREKEILDRIPAGRWGTPEDLAGAVVFLASNASNYVNGYTIYVLFEVPTRNSPYNIDDAVDSILRDGKIPILAHPERYDFVQSNPNWLLDYIKKGVLFQSNYASIIGRYGESAKDTVKKLLTHNMVHFLGSDNHNPNAIYAEMPKILKKLEKLVGKEYLDLLSVKNPQCILNNEKIEIVVPEKIND